MKEAKVHIIPILKSIGVVLGFASIVAGAAIGFHKIVESDRWQRQTDSILIVKVNSLGSDAQSIKRNMVTREEFYSAMQSQDKKLDFVARYKDLNAKELIHGLDSLKILILEEQAYRNQKKSFVSGVIAPDLP